MFRVQRIDHVEMFVPDRFEAAAWYERVLGLEVVPEYRFWADDPRGPLMISSDGGATKLALFEGAPPGRAPTSGFRRVAFRVTGRGFQEFLRRLPELNLGLPPGMDAVVDHDKSYSVYFSDPWGHPLEVTTYDYDEVTAAFTEHGYDE
jgi:catechol 2,3-dioxygenase-like lactoylglutathione lyase family enzyme